MILVQQTDEKMRMAGTFESTHASARVLRLCMKGSINEPDEIFRNGVAIGSSFHCIDD